MTLQPSLCPTWTETPDRFSHNAAHMKMLQLKSYKMTIHLIEFIKPPN